MYNYTFTLNLNYLSESLLKINKYWWKLISCLSIDKVAYRRALTADALCHLMLFNITK